MNSIVLVLLYTIIVLVLVIFGGNVRDTTDGLNLPFFYPPTSLFGLVWSILFIIFGIFIYYAPLYLQITGIILLVKFNYKIVKLKLYTRVTEG